MHKTAEEMEQDAKNAMADGEKVMADAVTDAKAAGEHVAHAAENAANHVEAEVEKM